MSAVLEAYEWNEGGVPAAKRSTRWMVLKAYAQPWMSTTLSAGTERRVALMAWRMCSVAHGMSTPRCGWVRDGPVSGINLMQTMAVNGSHNSPMATSRVPHLLCFPKATSLLVKTGFTRGSVNASMALTKATQVWRHALQPKITAGCIVCTSVLARSFTHIRLRAP
jgi:hypothetical protein